MFIVVLTVVQHEDRFLFVEEAKERVRGKWNLPGGRVEPGESLLEAAVRETEEEAGLSVELLGLLSVDQRLAQIPNAPDSMRFVFKARALSHQLKLHADEHSLRAAWLAPNELAHLPMRSPNLERIVGLALCATPLLPLTSMFAPTRDERRSHKP
jgi:ADP-ribose pyrophosphatase YjhB (NUDIX family)